MSYIRLRRVHMYAGKRPSRRRPFTNSVCYSCVPVHALLYLARFCPKCQRFRTHRGRHRPRSHRCPPRRRVIGHRPTGRQAGIYLSDEGGAAAATAVLAVMTDRDRSRPSPSLPPVQKRKRRSCSTRSFVHAIGFPHEIAIW